MQDKPRAEVLCDDYLRLKGERANFESYWQSLHDYYYVESENLNTTYYPGTELNAQYLYDSTTLEAADILASGFMNYLTPATSMWHGLSPKNPKLKSDKSVCTFLEDVRDQVMYTLAKSNFYNEMYSSYKSSGVYGTSALLEEEDIQDDVRFYSLPLKNICLVEDGRGRVCEYYIEFEYTAQQAETRWGREKLSTEMQQELEGDKSTTKKHLFLLFIAQRYRRDVNKTDRRNLPIEAVWIDEEAKKTIDEGGYNEFPAFCHRFDKRPFIQWGFSPGMKALPFARILNTIAKTNLRMMMKHTDPPIAVPDNAFIMPFNANPRATNYYNKKYMDKGASDIFAFGNYGNPEVGMTAIEYYTQKVNSIMYTDIFLAFNQIDKRMNNPEIMERINEKMTMLGPAVGRYISEFLNPVIIRTIGTLFRRGKLPRPPDAFRQNPDYEIDCISQLAQAQRRSELNTLVSGLTLVGQMAQFSPEVVDKVSPDKVIDEAWSIIGAPDRVLRDDSEVQQLREARGNAAKQQQAMELASQGADVVHKGSQVDLNLAKAKSSLPGVVPTTSKQ
jgi:hypothetical protein